MTDELFEELMLSVTQAGQIQRGELKGARVSEFQDIDVRALRKRYNLKQVNFAALLGISVATLRNWEQGRRRPVGPARRLLQVADKHPEILLEIVA